MKQSWPYRRFGVGPARIRTWGMPRLSLGFPSLGFRPRSAYLPGPRSDRTCPTRGPHRRLPSVRLTATVGI